MIHPKPLPCSISACLMLMLMSMGVTGLSQAGTYDEAPAWGDAEAHVPHVKMAYETDRIIIKYRQQTVGAAAFRSLAWQVLQATGLSMTHMYTTGSGAQIFKLDEMKTIDELQLIIEEIETNPNVVYAEAMLREFIHVPAGELPDKHSRLSS